MKNRGFSFTEMLTVVLIVGAISAATVPLITVKKKMKNYESNAVVCVKQALPIDTSTTACQSAINYSKNNMANSVSTLMYFADNGTSNEKTMARRVLKETCDSGGESACNYFVEACMKDSNLCDIGGTDDDLAYYLKLAQNDNSLGRLKIINLAKSAYIRNNPNIMAITDNNCCDRDLTPALNTACMVSGTTECLKAWCWGNNEHGQLGDNSTTQSKAPVEVVNDHIFTVVTTGRHSSCGLDTTGRAWCWGRNNRGQLGNGTTTTNLIPVEVSGEHLFSSIHIWRLHVCGLDTAGEAWCWGLNSSGQLGDDSTGDKHIPTAVDITDTRPDTYVSISTGYAHTCAIDTNSKIWCWGSNNVGELGDNTIIDKDIPVEAQGVPAFEFLEVGFDYSCALDINGKAWCWGENGYGQLGDGSNEDRWIPVEVTDSHIFTQITVGEDHTCALDTNGDAWCWGYGTDGALGNGSTDHKVIPVKVSGDHNFSSIDAGRRYTCAIDTDNKAWCWGNNYYGQIGDDTYMQRNTPVPVNTDTPRPSTYTAVSAGYGHACALEIFE